MPIAKHPVPAWLRQAPNEASPGVRQEAKNGIQQPLKVECLTICFNQPQELLESSFVYICPQNRLIRKLRAVSAVSGVSGSLAR